MPEVPSYWERPLCPSSDQCLSPSGKRIPPQEPPPPAWPPSPAETQAGSSRAALGTLRAAAAMHCPDPGYLRTRSHPGLCRPGPGRRDPCPSRQAPGALSTVVAQVWASLPRAICQRLLTGNALAGPSPVALFVNICKIYLDMGWLKAAENLNPHWMRK